MRQLSAFKDAPRVVDASHGRDGKVTLRPARDPQPWPAGGCGPVHPIDRALGNPAGRPP